MKTLALLAALAATDARLDEGLVKVEADLTHPLHAATFLRVGLKPKQAPAPRSEKPDWTLSDKNRPRPAPCAAQSGG